MNGCSIDLYNLFLFSVALTHYSPKKSRMKTVKEKKKYTNPHFNATRVSAQVGDIAMRGYNNLDISCFITAE